MEGLTGLPRELGQAFHRAFEEVIRKQGITGWGCISDLIYKDQEARKQVLTPGSAWHLGTDPNGFSVYHQAEHS